jgi:hypothetical protein
MEVERNQHVPFQAGFVWRRDSISLLTANDLDQRYDLDDSDAELAGVYLSASPPRLVLIASSSHQVRPRGGQVPDSKHVLVFLVDLGPG